jgi:hypothetical protein
MADNSRIEDLRRRVQKDPASIAFAQLAEECRRVGQYQESIDVCRAGLALHPGYLSARVTLGRALIEVDQLDEAQAELEVVLASASENLAAIRGLAEIFHRRGALADALKQYRVALTLARNDPDLERTVTELSRAIEPKPAEQVFDGLSFEQMADEFMKNLPPPPPPVAVAPVVETAPVEVASVVEAASIPEPSPAVVSYETPEALPSPEMDVAPPTVWEDTAFRHTSAVGPPPAAPEVATSEAPTVDLRPSVPDEGSDTVSDPVSDTVSDTVSDPVSDTVSDPVSDTTWETSSSTVSDLAVDAPSGHNGTAHNGTAHDLALVAGDTLIPSLHTSPEETASPVDWIGQQTEVPAVVLSESPLAEAADLTLTDEDATPPVEGASRSYAQATIAALDQWLDAIHVARADRRA